MRVAAALGKHPGQGLTTTYYLVNVLFVLCFERKWSEQRGNYNNVVLCVCLFRIIWKL